MDPAHGLLENPHDVYRRLRESAPVHRAAGPDGSPAWLVTRYEDVRAALADPRLSLDKARAKEGSYRGLSLPPALDANLLNMDPPDHTRIRRLVARAFTTRRVEHLRIPIRRTADRLLDALGPHGTTDLIAAYAAPLPITVICDLLGVPDDHRRDFRAWTGALVAPDPARPTAAKEAVVAMLGFFTGLIAAKRTEPADDLLSDLIAVRGVTVPAGETVLLSLAAANRDPARFPDPGRLDLGRDTSGHLALGHAIHHCLGAPLARAETEIALAALLERFPELALASDAPRWRPSPRARGLVALPVTYAEKTS
ncbi:MULTISPECIES: cytochrome P450 [Streptomyces]|uniref:cytochrome P450 n=1 Tax=Streptomyces TaxID=1883 RepID=UPI00287FAC35|nr:cytochrome P450 [Streptomyces sp. CGMCC 4.1456]WNF61694.1 cytochrome P450 [Streptomyces sp. CGMCC 4.1456]